MPYRQEKGAYAHSTPKAPNGQGQVSITLLPANDYHLRTGSGPSYDFTLKSMGNSLRSIPNRRARAAVQKSLPQRALSAPTRLVLRRFHTAPHLYRVVMPGDGQEVTSWASLTNVVLSNMSHEHLSGNSSRGGTSPLHMPFMRRVSSLCRILQECVLHCVIAHTTPDYYG
jgi:hypothetical protein